MEKTDKGLKECFSALSVMVLTATYLVGFFTILTTEDWTLFVIALVLNAIAMCYIKYVTDGKIEVLTEKNLELEHELFDLKYVNITKYDYKTVIVGITPGIHNHKEELEKGDNSLNKYLNEGYEIFRQQFYCNDSSCFYFMILRKHQN